MITKERLKELERKEAKLQALENGGVDSWSYYDEALTEYFEHEEKEEKLDKLMVDIEEAVNDGVYEPARRGAGFAIEEDSIETIKELIKEFLDD